MEKNDYKYYVLNQISNDTLEKQVFQRCDLKDRKIYEFDPSRNFPYETISFSFYHNLSDDWWRKFTVFGNEQYPFFNGYGGNTVSETSYLLGIGFYMYSIDYSHGGSIDIILKSAEINGKKFE